MSSAKLTGRDYVKLGIAAIASLAVLVAAQCPALSVGDEARSVLAIAAAGLSLLCVAILLEDLIVSPLRQALKIAADLLTRRRASGLRRPRA